MILVDKNTSYPSFWRGKTLAKDSDNLYFYQQRSQTLKAVSALCLTLISRLDPVISRLEPPISRLSFCYSRLTPLKRSFSSEDATLLVD